MWDQFFASGAICSINSKEVLIGWGDPEWKAVPAESGCFFLPDFFLEAENPYLHFPHTKVVANQEIKTLTHAFSLNFGNPSWDIFENYFQLFKKSGLKKAVPYVAKKAFQHITAKYIQSFLHHALHYQSTNPATFLYGFWDKTQGMIGVTPEIIASKDGGALRSLACAGTVQIQDANNMLHDPKLMHEHELVIEGLKHELGAFGEVSIGSTEVIAYSKIAHLVTSLMINLNPTDKLESLIAAIHPSPAIGTFPKNQGRDYLASLEKVLPRKRFGAPFGALIGEKAHIYLAIRNISWEKDEVTMMAGCGIVSISDLENEKLEILAKFSSIEEILGLKK